MGYADFHVIEEKLKTTTNPITLMINEFYPGNEANFRFTVWYKHKQGKVSIEKF